MTQETENKVDVNVNREAEFQLYVVWRSLPPLLRFPPKDKGGNIPTPESFAMQMGIDDDTVLDLVQIKRQGDFAVKYGLHPDTLTDWNKKIEEHNLLDDIRVWARKLTRNMVVSLYNNAIKKGNPHSYALWFKLIDQWEEKIKLEHEGSVTQLIIVTDEKQGQNSNVATDKEANQSVDVSLG